MKFLVPGGGPVLGRFGVVVAFVAALAAVQADGQEKQLPPFSVEEERTLEICRERLRVVPTHAYFLDKLVAIHRRRGRLPQALARYCRSAEPTGQLVAARLLTEAGRPREAAHRLTRLLTDARWGTDAHLLLARLKARQMDSVGALVHYRAVLETPRARGREKILLEAASQAMRVRRRKEALMFVGRIRSVHRREAFYRQHQMTKALIGSLEARWKAGRSTAQRLSTSSQLVSLSGSAGHLPICLRHAAYILDHTGPGHWTRRQLFGLLERLGRQGHADVVMPVLRVALGKNPRDSDLRLVMVQLRTSQGKLPKAIALLRQGLRLEDRPAAQLRTRLADLLVQHGRLSEAEKLLSAAEKGNPQILLRRLRLALETDSRDSLGLIVEQLITSRLAGLADLLEAEGLLRRLGQSAAARCVLLAAAKRWPRDHRCLIRLARAAHHAGRKAQAVAWARRACALRSLAARQEGVFLLARCDRTAEAFTLLEGWSGEAGGLVYLELASKLARGAGDTKREQAFLLSRYRTARPEWIPVLSGRIAKLGSVTADQTRTLSLDRAAWLEAARLLETGRITFGLEQMTFLAHNGPAGHLLTLARQARQHRRDQLARDAYHAYLQTRRGQADRHAALELSALMMIGGQERQLVRWFDSLIGRFPDETQLYLLQADLALRTDDWPEALDVLGRGLVACGEKPRLLLAMAQIQCSLGRRRPAAAVYHRLAAASRGEYRDKAIQALLELPGPNKPVDAISLEVQVRRHLQRGEREQALTMLSSSVGRFPAQPQLLRLHGELQLASGLGDRSAQLLRRVLLMDKHPDPTLARLLARSLALSGKPTEARRLVDRMAARRPLSRARTYLACGLFPAAIEELETFKKRHGNSPALEQLLLVAYLADGRDPQGRKLEERRK